ncbi:MAG: hypothetical protein B6D61_10700 [Bacteroidetes bacterium 4484_249]|nr:MAG: hypothetical protein B6D61_10700 [Bacteroidetes bacterium 4484_249]
MNSTIKIVLLIFLLPAFFNLYSQQTFTPVTSQVGISVAVDNMGQDCAWADIDNDGAIDFFASGHWSIQKLYENQYCPNNFLVLNLVGTELNRDAIGIKVKVKASDIEIFRTVIAGDGGNNFNSLPLEFGLGQNTNIDLIEIYWTNSPMQTITNVAANSFLTVTEGDPVNIEENSDDIVFECYPNPFTKNFSVKLKNSESADLNLDLFDGTGKLMVQYSVSAEESMKRYINLNLEKNNLNNGIYFLKI